MARPRIDRTIPRTGSPSGPPVAVLALGLVTALTACSGTPGDAQDGGVDACWARTCVENPGHPADEVVEAPGDTGAGEQDAQRAVNGVRGCGGGCGGTDVFSLGYEAGVDNFITLRWSGRRVVDGPGADFVIFENGFRASDGHLFMDLVLVFLSRDGVTWVPFPHDYAGADETVYTPDPALWPGFAGAHPVLLHEEENPVDPFNAQAAGGDAFDLADLPDDGGESQAIKAEGFAYLKLVSAPSETNPDTGAPFVRELISNGADIDGVYARYLADE